VGTIKIDDDKKCRQIAGKFDHHGDVSVRCKAHRPVEHIPGFTMPLDAAIGRVPGPRFVIGHGIGGKYIPIMARLAKARRWSKR